MVTPSPSPLGHPSYFKQDQSGAFYIFCWCVHAEGEQLETNRCRLHLTDLLSFCSTHRSHPVYLQDIPDV